VVSPSNIEQHVLRLIQQRLASAYDVSPSAIRLGTRFREDLNADSLDLLELLIALQEELDVIITDDEASNLITVSDVIVFCARRLSSPGTSPLQRSGVESRDL